MAVTRTKNETDWVFLEYHLMPSRPHALLHGGHKGRDAIPLGKLKSDIAMWLVLQNLHASRLARGYE